MAAGSDRRMTGSTSDSQQRRHFGYWINRRRRARCYECQFQFVGDDTTAEQWVGQPRPGQPGA